MLKKKILTLALSVLMAGSGALTYGKTTNVHAEETSVATAKMNFAMAMDKKYAEMNRETPMARNVINNDDLISQAFFADGEEKELLLEELANNGIYLFTMGNDTLSSEEEATSQSNLVKSEEEISPNGIAIYPNCGTGDVSIYAPEVYYQASNQTWVVSCGGKWKNGNALPTFSMFETNIGGPDAFGVGYTSIKTSYNSSVVQSYAYIEDNSGSQRETTENRSDGDGSLGFGFRLQDKQFSTPTFTTYVGYIWYGACTYDSQYASFDAVATSYYTHTYSTATINGVSFGVQGKSAGVTVDVSKQSKSFTGYSIDTVI